MANTSKVCGLRPVKHITGAPFNDQANIYYILSTDTNAYAIGDPVSSSGSGDGNGVPGCQLATAGATHALRGVIVGIGTKEQLMADPSNLDTTIIPATKTKAYYVMVADSPDLVFEVQEGGSGTTFTVADIGANANLGSSTNTGYVSGWYLDNGTATASDVSYQVKLLGLSRRSDNAIGQYAKWLVMINLHELRAGVTGA